MTFRTAIGEKVPHEGLGAIEATAGHFLARKQTGTVASVQKV